MKKGLRAGIIILAVVAIAAIVWINRNKTEALHVLKVGVILPQTGPSSYIGTSIKNGIDIAIQEFNSRVEKPFALNVTFLDTNGQAARVVTSWRVLQTSFSPQTIIAVQEGVKGLIPLAQNDKIVLLATSVPDNGIAGVNPWTFRFFINAKTDAGMMAQYAVKVLAKKRFGIIYVNDSMGVSYRESFVDAINKLGGEIVAEQNFGMADTDFRSQVLRLKEAAPDGIYLIGYGKSLSSIPIQLRENGVTSTLFSVGTISQPDIMAAAGAAVEGCYYTTSEFFTFAPATKELQAFVNSFQKQFGQVPVFFEVFGYDSLRLILHAAEQSVRSSKQSGLSPEAILSSLAATKNLALASGMVTVDAGGDVKFPVVVKVIKDGKWAPAPMPLRGE